MLAWEQKLQDRQKKLDEEQRFLDEREKEADGRDIVLKKYEEELEEARKEMEVANNSLKNKEREISAGLEALDAKEKVRFKLVLLELSQIYCLFLQLYFFRIFVTLIARSCQGRKRDV